MVWGFPACTHPQPVVDKLVAEVIKAARHPELIKRLAVDGTEAVGSLPDAFVGHLKAEMAPWSRVVKDSGIKAD